MDTYMTVTAYGTNAEDATTKAEERINELDELLSTGSEDSEVSKLNQTGKAVLSEDTAILMQKSLDLYQETNGAFNVAIYPIMQAWGFTTGDYKVPAESELQQLLSLTDVDKISYDNQTKEVEFLMDGMEIDFGGIAKGYTSSEIMDIFKDYGIESGLVSLGGNVQTFGYKTDGSQWKVAVQNPDETEDYLGILETHDKAVITSGGYERYFEEDGKTYHHIIDPETGSPAQNGLTSVTIVSSDGMLADGLSTSLFVMGLDKARANSDKFDAILLTEDGELYVTEGISDDFTSDLEINLIRR
jgi:thiamine biosynthesis lipoprotein